MNHNVTIIIIISLRPIGRTTRCGAQGDVGGPVGAGVYINIHIMIIIIIIVMMIIMIMIRRRRTIIIRRRRRVITIINCLLLSSQSSSLLVWLFVAGGCGGPRWGERPRPSSAASDASRRASRTASRMATLASRRWRFSLRSTYIICRV